MKVDRKSIAAAVLMVSAASLFTLGAAAAESPVDFAVQIRPILADKCVRCHGPDESARPRRV